MGYLVLALELCALETWITHKIHNSLTFVFEDQLGAYTVSIPFYL